MDKILFLYDELILKETQNKLNVKLEFLSAGQTNAKKYRLNDSKNYRTFILPRHTTNLVYGGIFLLHNYEENKYKLHAWHNNSIPFTNETLLEDLYDLQEIKVTPIKLTLCSETEYLVADKTDQIECDCFIGNKRNEYVLHCLSNKYWNDNRVNKEVILKMIKENRKEITL